jgi:hypothetical protein
MAAIEAGGTIETRRQHLTALAGELRHRGLDCRLLGPDESVLRVINATTGRKVMILASPTANGWSFLWSGGGIADAADPADAADRIARALS